MCIAFHVNVLNSWKWEEEEEKRRENRMFLYHTFMRFIFCFCFLSAYIVSFDHAIALCVTYRLYCCGSLKTAGGEGTLETCLGQTLSVLPVRFFVESLEFLSVLFVCRETT